MSSFSKRRRQLKRQQKQQPKPVLKVVETKTVSSEKPKSFADLPRAIVGLVHDYAMELSLTMFCVQHDIGRLDVSVTMRRLLESCFAVGIAYDLNDWRNCRIREKQYGAAELPLPDQINAYATKTAAVVLDVI